MPRDGDLIGHAVDDIGHFFQNFLQVVIHRGAARREHGGLFLIHQLDAQTFGRIVYHQILRHVGQARGILNGVAQGLLGIFELFLLALGHLLQQLFFRQLLGFTFPRGLAFLDLFVFFGRITMPGRCQFHDHRGRRGA